MNPQMMESPAGRKVTVRTKKLYYNLKAQGYRDVKPTQRRAPAAAKPESKPSTETAPPDEGAAKESK